MVVHQQREKAAEKIFEIFPLEIKKINPPKSVKFEDKNTTIHHYTTQDQYNRSGR